MRVVETTPQEPWGGSTTPVWTVGEFGVTPV
jgi:hypothetical protein